MERREPSTNQSKSIKINQNLNQSIETTNIPRAEFCAQADCKASHGVDEGSRGEEGDGGDGERAKHGWMGCCKVHCRRTEARNKGQTPRPIRTHFVSSHVENPRDPQDLPVRRKEERRRTPQNQASCKGRSRCKSRRNLHDMCMLR